MLWYIYYACKVLWPMGKCQAKRRTDAVSVYFYEIVERRTMEKSSS